jgi:hypothetical protein
MDPLRIITEQHGVFLRREALECGYDDKTLGRLRRSGILHRVRHGAYCFSDVWATYSTEERHLVLARAVLRTTPGPVALSHTTALLLHGIAVWGADLRRVHVTRLDGGAARIERDVVHHDAVCPGDDVMKVAGLPVVTPPRAVIEAATVHSLESALVSADNALHLGRCSASDLYETFEALHHWPGSQKIHVLLNQMDGRAESVGETRALFLFWRQGLPKPELQFEVYDAHGRLVAVLDFVWHQHRVFGEFDGKVKYGRYLREGEEPGDAVFREKQREDLVRSITGYGCGRLVWHDLSVPRETGDRFRSLLGIAAA